ncbi:MAG: MmgE/PrpD family protein [Burkholderiaceae bacterium]|nr:MmgE/PrpD family protein [Burkholderiaceae bacterium]
MASDGQRSADSATTLPSEVTRELAKYIVRARYEDMPAAVRREGLRTLVNWVGAAVGGSHHDGIDRAVAALAPFSAASHAAILGRSERLDIMNAAFVNGVSSHILDFDDTHLKTIIHPAASVAPAILAFSEYRNVAGREFLNALILGVETECRIGNAVYPDHYDRGWHITGTCGAFGAAAAMGKLLDLSEQQMRWALGLAASQPVGFRESFGSMNKSFNPGRAAHNGMTAAVLAHAGFTSSDRMIEASRGWAHTISDKQDWRKITGGLGAHYEALLNTYKPFACGVVLHPAIDAAIQLRNRHGLRAEDIERIELRVHPLVLELTGKTAPATGLDGKFSVYHAVAAAIIDGAAGPKQFSDSAVREPSVIALRAKVAPTADPSIEPEQVDCRIVLRDGRTVHQRIEDATGSAASPLTDEALEVKFLGLAEGILTSQQARRLLDACWNIERSPSAATIAEAAVPR